jgi:hypothetical protein
VQDSWEAAGDGSDPVIENDDSWFTEAEEDEEVVVNGLADGIQMIHSHQFPLKSICHLSYIPLLTVGNRTVRMFQSLGLCI